MQHTYIEKVIACLNENKAANIELLDLSHRECAMETIVVCSGISTRHLSALRKRVLEVLIASENRPLHKPQESIDWVLIDTGSAVIHIMLSETRELYDIEGLWREYAR